MQKLGGDPLEQAFPNIKHNKVYYSNDVSSTCDLWKVLSTNKSSFTCEEVLLFVCKALIEISLCIWRAP